MKAFKKPIPVKFQYILAPIVIETLEGPVNAGPGQVLMTGPRNDPYPISQESFWEWYNVDEDLAVAYKKKTIVDAKQITEPTAVKVAWSGQELWGKPGDYLVTYESDKQWIVEKSIFEETYEIVN